MSSRKQDPNRLRNRLGLLLFRLGSAGKEKFECPICGYVGPFRDVAPHTGLRTSARCPKCFSFERHRNQFLVMRDLLQKIGPSNLKMLHFAPEPFFRDMFARQFGSYECADLNRKDVDHNVDLQKLPFADTSFDVVYASHVLEHVPDDRKAIAEIRRILRPGGIAVLPVPLVVRETIEYPQPNPKESGHVRAPGADYFERYRPYFSRVDLYRSGDFPERFQLYVREDRTVYPSVDCPLRTPTPGDRHEDIVPVCHV
ncbi:MAG: class I SAM-dependent methyltransferase [Pseudomonadota bacterium]